ncbi:MAG TPA: calcium/proton exchanger [Ktedonobacteraceae bacterium]|nr:calcium/proton exchanger [Ktedonobacteraceae bacterium]
MSRWFYYLLVMAVVAPAIDLIWGSQQAPLAIFICSTIALVPLAALIGRATENLEPYVGPIAGGLLNATFGNAPELIIGIFAVRAGLLRVVQASMIGSVISNSLLVLGSSLALGGWRWGRQYFNAHDAGQYSAMMLLAVAGLLIPSTSALVIQDQGRLQLVSNAIACVLLVVYALYLLAHVFKVRSERRNPKHAGRAAQARSTSQEEHEEVEAFTGQIDPQQDASENTPSLWFSLIILLIATLGTAWNSELLVGTITPVTEALGWSPVFVGLVIIPIVGNAAEHSSALYIALRDRVDLSMAIAAGSSIQVATLVAPMLVLISMFFPHHLNLVFPPLELVALGAAVLLFSVISLDGESSWLAGVQLIAIYLMASIVFFFIPGPG